MPKYNNELSGNVNEREMRDLKKWKKMAQTKQCLNVKYGIKTKSGLGKGVFFILGERERDGEREEEKRGLILSIFPGLV